jgi:ABC-type multidrug transport system fused ATPase/permease subunit
MSKGELVTYVCLVSHVSAPLSQMTALGSRIVDSIASLDQVGKLRMLTQEKRDRESPKPVPKLEGDVAFRNVWFSYQEGAPVLKGIHLLCPAGTSTALVGPSGSGKSTLVALLMSFYRRQRGTVTVDGLDISTLELDGYRSQLGVVLQETVLFNGTIRENIAFARPFAGEDKVRWASAVAHCDEFVRACPTVTTRWSASAG